jgi:hypothetical protein
MADLKKLGDEAKKRLQEARKFKTALDQDFREGYFFAAPHRRRSVSSSNAPSISKPGDEADLHVAQAFELAPDFATVVINSIMPQHENWAERRKGPAVTSKEWKDIGPDVAAEDTAIFDAMRASSLYAELGKSFVPDLAIGTVAVWIDDPIAAAPVRVLSVPIRELEISLGPDGNVDDRWVVRHRKWSQIPALLGPGVKIPAEMARLNKGSDKVHEVRWGFWRDWSARDAETWQHVVMIGPDCIHGEKIKGEGCCPLIVGRWNPSPDSPWGHGPLLQSLCELREADHMAMALVDAIDFSIRPPLGIPDTSIGALEDGLEAGAAYPMRSGDQIEQLYQPVSIDPAIYAQQQRQQLLRKLFFVDYPEQTGDTPMSATQWIDEMALAQRRLGTPGMSFWREFACAIFTRFGYLLRERGIVEDHRADGKVVALWTANPMQRAAELQEVSDNLRTLQAIAALFPEEYKLRVDGMATMMALVEKTRSNLIKWRRDQDVQAAIGQITQMMGQGGAAPPAGGVPQ